MRGWLPSLLDDLRFPSVTLRQTSASLTTGPFGTMLAAGEYVDGGTPLINPTHISEGKFNPDPAISVSLETARRLERHRLLKGDIVIGRHGDVGRSAVVTDEEQGWLCGGGSIALRPPPQGLDSRFLQWVLTSGVARAQLLAASNGATMDTINEPILMGLGIPLPDIRIQRDITDYLDAETERIDALTEKKQRMVGLLEEEASLALQASMQSYGFTFPEVLDPQWGEVSLPDGWSVLHLNQTLLQLTNGFVGPTRDILFDDGIKYVQSLHIKGGVIDFDRRPFYVAREWHDARPRVHLRPEDVLIVQTGDIGQVAVVPSDFGEASCHALQIARVRPEAVSGSYLGEYLRTPFAYHSLLKRATGALHPHLEGGIRDVPVVAPPRTVQDSLVAEASSRRRKAEEVIDRLTKQVDLLVEHRQALITAAVTGQLDFSGLAA